MSGTNDDTISRRDFIKAVATIIGGFIGAVTVIPAMAYLISPSLRKVDDESWIDLGPLEKYPPDLPTLFQFSRTKENGWEKSSMSYGVFVVRRSETDIRVFSNICMHLGCHVAWHPNAIQDILFVCRYTCS